MVWIVSGVSCVRERMCWGNSRDETERAETTLIRVVETANFEFPPDVVRDDDVSTTAEVQWDVGEEGE